MQIFVHQRARGDLVVATRVMTVKQHNDTQGQGQARSMHLKRNININIKRAKRRLTNTHTHTRTHTRTENNEEKKKKKTDLHEGLRGQLELDGRVGGQRPDVLEALVGRQPVREHRVERLVDGDDLVHGERHRPVAREERQHRNVLGVLAALDAAAGGGRSIGGDGGGGQPPATRRDPHHWVRLRAAGRPPTEDCALRHGGSRSKRSPKHLCLCVALPPACPLLLRCCGGGCCCCVFFGRCMFFPAGEIILQY
jgi:hypothetical protein